MQTYIKNNQYGRAIFENLDCLLDASVQFDMTESFTDYYDGFKNLVQLHYEARTINERERDILISYLDEVMKNPVSANGKTSKWDNDLKYVDTNLTPLFC